MKIERVTLREIGMRLKAPFETSFGVVEQRRILLVEVIADGVTGWGEITALETPSYNSETTDTAWHVVGDFIAPLVIGRDLACAAETAALLAGIRGHSMAKAGLENALWDIESQQKGIPLWRLVGGTRHEIACGVSLGIRPTPASLREEPPSARARLAQRTPHRRRRAGGAQRPLSRRRCGHRRARLPRRGARARR